jgi:putative spermidine/putrescine transport system ATP-binding protein
VSTPIDESFDLELRNLSKHFGDFVATRDIDLKVKKGEFLSLLGPSGCGKTTTLRIVAGFIEPTTGEVFIKGRFINDIPAYKRNVGMCFQSYALFPHLTVENNLAFGLKLRKLDRKRIREKVEEGLELVRLGGKNERYPSELSGGEQQRVSLARALVIEPDLLLLDEPLSNLDAKLRGEMRIELKRIQEMVGITSIFVTHDQEEALVLSDRIVVMNKGGIEQIGTPTEIYEKPGSEFVARFIGEANFFEGIVTHSDETRVTIQAEDGRLPVIAAQTGELRAGTRVKFIVRPERLHFASDDRKGAGNLFRGSILFASYIGSICQYVCRLEGCDKQILVSVQGTVGGIPMPEGTAVTLSWSPESCTIFETRQVRP